MTIDYGGMFRRKYGLTVQPLLVTAGYDLGDAEEADANQHAQLQRPAAALSWGKAPLKGANDYLKFFAPMADYAREELVIVLLDADQRPFAVYPASQGTATQSIVPLQQMASVIVLSGAAGIVVAHNHPSGQSAPSREDIVFTRALQGVCAALGVQMLASLVVATGVVARIETGADDCTVEP